MPVGRGRQAAAPGCALQKTDLEQVGLKHGFNGVGILPQNRRQGGEAHGSPFKLLRHGQEQAMIAGIEAQGINAVHGQGIRHHLVVNGGTGFHQGVVPDTAEQSIGDAGRAATTAGNGLGAGALHVHLQQLRRTLHNLP